MDDQSQIVGNGIVKPDTNEIESISILADEESVRAGKRTTVYVIEFTIDGQKFITKRSYSEFRYLYK